MPSCSLSHLVILMSLVSFNFNEAQAHWNQRHKPSSYEVTFSLFTPSILNLFPEKHGPHSLDPHVQTFPCAYKILILKPRPPSSKNSVASFPFNYLTHREQTGVAGTLLNGGIKFQCIDLPIQ